MYDLTYLTTVFYSNKFCTYMFGIHWISGVYLWHLVNIKYRLILIFIGAPLSGENVFNGKPIFSFILIVCWHLLSVSKRLQVIHCQKLAFNPSSTFGRQWAPYIYIYKLTVKCHVCYGYWVSRFHLPLTVYELFKKMLFSHYAGSPKKKRNFI